ncbi:hypothetical protein IW262DRAFT_1294574 [Armillaria fumosa]|nr:hypothetical protein IW262DRAFT_1294574 [Armillaria fumosa]
MSNQTGSQFGSIRRRESCYLTGGDVYFLVEEYIFRVHRIFFERESQKFRQMFEHPTPPGGEPAGTSIGSALKLEDVTANDFSKFLWIFYNPKYSLYDASVDEWHTILRIASDWGFAEVKALAIRELERKDISLVDRIVLYQAYNVDQEIMVPLYAKLCSRPEPLNKVESQKLGVETVVLIFHARERLRSSSHDGVRSPLPDGVNPLDVMQVVSEMWQGDDVSSNRSSGGWVVDRVPTLLSKPLPSRRARRTDPRVARMADLQAARLPDAAVIRDRPLPSTPGDSDSHNKAFGSDEELLSVEKKKGLGQETDSRGVANPISSFPESERFRTDSPRPPGSWVA